ncbi:MAG: hypothetical protein AMXMBFR4_10150 [Candidatus Hydrogenedentota bacterium]
MGVWLGWAAGVAKSFVCGALEPAGQLDPDIVSDPNPHFSPVAPDEGATGEKCSEDSMWVNGVRILHTYNPFCRAVA